MSEQTVERRRFDDVTAVVTGAASGIGRAITARLVAEGAAVIGVDIDQEALDGLTHALGASFTPVVADVTVEADVAEAAAVAVRTHGRLDLAFNVAGAARMGAIVDLDEADWDFTVDLVQKGVFLSTKHEARHMRDCGNGGAIVNISSLNAHVPMPGGSPYNTGKAGVESFSRTAAVELAQYGIRVNCVLPGLVDTPLVGAVMGYQPMLDAFTDRIPQRRAGTPEEIAGPCLYLASADAAYITGAALVVDGGWEQSNYPDLGGVTDRPSL